MEIEKQRRLFSIYYTQIKPFKDFNIHEKELMSEGYLRIGDYGFLEVTEMGKKYCKDILGD